MPDPRLEKSNDPTSSYYKKPSPLNPLKLIGCNNSSTLPINPIPPSVAQVPPRVIYSAEPPPNSALEPVPVFSLSSASTETEIKLTNDSNLSNYNSILASVCKIDTLFPSDPRLEKVFSDSASLYHYSHHGQEILSKLSQDPSLSNFDTSEDMNLQSDTDEPTSPDSPEICTSTANISQLQPKTHSELVKAINSKNHYTRFHCAHNTKFLQHICNLLNKGKWPYFISENNASINNIKILTASDDGYYLAHARRVKGREKEATIHAVDFAYPRQINVYHSYLLKEYSKPAEKLGIKPAFPAIVRIEMANLANA